MSVKKDRFNKRKHRGHDCGGHSFWDHAPSSFRRELNRGRRARNRQLLREGRYESFVPWLRDAAWLYWAWWPLIAICW
jgi:hypothetical protein